MKNFTVRNFLLSTVLIFSTAFGLAQTTAVTASITDSDGQAWVNGSWSASLYNPSGTQRPVYRKTGQPVPVSLSGGLNSSGAMSYAVPDNLQIDPAGTQWVFTFCSNTSASCSVMKNQTVTGTSEDFSSSFSGQVTTPRFTAIAGTYGYLDVEASNPVKGSTYFNVISNAQRTYNGTAWVNSGMTYCDGSGNCSFNTVAAGDSVFGGPTVDVRKLGCVMNSQVSADMTSNVTCLTYAISHAGEYIIPPGTLYLNGAANAVGTVFTGFNVHGMSETGTTIQQTANNVPILEWSSPNSSSPILANSWEIHDLTLTYSTQQTAPTNETTVSPAPAILFNGANTSAFYRFQIYNLFFANASRGIDMAKKDSSGTTSSQTAWAYDIHDITGAGSLTGATINLFPGNAAGNPRCMLRNIYSTQYVAEPVLAIPYCQGLIAQDIEINNGLNLAFDFTSTYGGDIDGVHIEQHTITAAGTPLIQLSNSNLTVHHVDATVHNCPPSSSCAGASNPTVYYASSTSGGGNLIVDDVYMGTYGDSNSTTQLYAARYGTNPTTASVTRMSANPPSGGAWGLVEPGSDAGLAVQNNKNLSATTLNTTAQTFSLTTVTPNGGNAIYGGTITGGDFNAYVGSWWNVTGCTNSANNGWYFANGSTATSLYLVNTSSVSSGSETCSAQEAVPSTPFSWWARYMNSGTSTLESFQSVLTPSYNGVSGKWDNYLNLYTSGTQSGSRSFWSPGWTHVWLGKRSPTSPQVGGTWGYIRQWTRDTSFYAVPALTMARWTTAVGGISQYVNTEFRGASDGSGNALGEICTQTNAAAADGSETMPADRACQFMVDKSGNWYNQNGLTTPIIPSWATGYHGNSSGVRIPLATNWTNSAQAPICDDGNGNLTTCSSLPVTVVAKADVTGLSANTSGTLYTTPSNGGGSYLFTCFVVETQAATTSSTLPNCSIGFTDPDSNTAQNVGVTATQGANTVGKLGCPDGSGYSCSTVVQLKPSAGITYGTANYASSGATAMQYAIHVKLEYLGP